MRDILFKAKRKNWQKLSKEEQWIYGYYVQGFNMYEEPMHMIFDTLTRFYVQGETDGWEEIDPDTLCQYTGLTDKNGNKIWENDILVAHLDDKYPDDESYTQVIWHQNGFCTKEKWSPDREPLDDFIAQHYAVCGNIFDDVKLKYE